MIILALSTNLTACSLLNPYVNSSELKFVDPKAPDKESQPCSTLPNDMQEAVNCAHVVQSKYVENMGEQAMLSSVSGVGLISLTAYTAGIAINDAHTTNVTDFALGASAIYGMSQWLSQPERTKIYGLGIKAVQCAVDASVPFQTNSANMKQFDTDVKNLRTQIKYTSRDLETVKVLLDSNTQTVTKLTELDKAKVTSARQSIDEARTSATTAGQLIASYNHAPFELVATVNRINASVNAGLGDSIQSMSALPGTLSGILDMYSHLESGYVAHGYSPEGETKNGGAETEIKKAEIPPRQGIIQS
ncbi:hypothetical protein ACFQDL_30820 [Marinobacterium aestuariivivens]|uniref:Lipoprotein n=1 Tax=Marinobacterium aestuariivivens TaxID=1698799 RepID=A0ABW2A9E2_9GAMM